ncbi:MFS transporter [Leptolyngbya cf. ectocarpi LEGE 11479]|uniref:MFS transporter n=1 Tax=Leptolyngbya cf. ectocarpi LEGE 11479 TaxID=1828722 RepID=A0A928ZVD4_LEPEC|nr:MFS transporter [Leptolyngbya ectocarpi]MBE9068164.1 MFS transporter [Leptolyngbya cf. ectocarpi LEGE 11479]
MIEHWISSSTLRWGSVLSAQLSTPGVNTPEEAALVFSGPQFFIALLSGLILTFGFQLLLTNLSVAAGISYVGHSSSSSDDDSGGMGPRKIGIAFGLWTLITVSVALFFACLLAVKLSLYDSALLGAITGLVIWGTYFCLLFWVSSTTVGSLIGSVVRTATSSFQTLVGTATAAMGAKVASNQTIQTAEAAAAAIRQELSAAWNGDDLKESLVDYLNALRSPELDVEQLESEFERLLQTSDVVSASDQTMLRQIDRQAFVELLQDRTDLSRKEVNRVANRLYQRWQNTLSPSGGVESLVDYLHSAQPEQLMTEQLGQRLDKFLEEYRNQNRGQSQSAISRGVSQAINTVTGVLMGRVDLSDADMGKLRKQLQAAQSQLGSQANTLAAQVTSDNDESESTIKADVENYLLTSYPWQLSPRRLEAEFAQVLYDREADGRLLAQAIQRLNLSFFRRVLKSSGLLTQAEIHDTALRLETTRQQVLTEVTEQYRVEAKKSLVSKVDTFLRYTPRHELLSETGMGADAFRALLEDDSVDAAELEERFTQFGYEYFVRHLQHRSDLNDSDVKAIAGRLEQIMNKVLADAKGLQSSIEVRVNQQWDELQNYLRSTGKSELDPEGIKADISKLFDNPEVGSQRLQQRLSRFDRDTLVQLLSQRQEFSETEVQQVVQDVESAWYEALEAPATLTAQAKANYEQANRAIANYLRNTGKPELSPTGIKRDLELLVNEPKVGVDAIRSRLASMDRDTLVQLLNQRDDLSEAEINQVIDDLQENIQSVLRLPRRLARRSQQQVMSFKDALEDYLRSTDKAALNPEGIKRDLQLLLNDPKLGSERLQERLAQVDRDTVVALVSQRDDIAREDVEATVDQVISVRDQMMAQVQQVQAQLQTALNRILDQVRQYLDSLDRPELNYYGIKRDVSKLFDDPQAGFDALQQRLSQFDRNTLVALMSSHKSMSEADANRVIAQVEDARDGALRKAERMEQQVQSRISELKQQAQKQVDDTRKTAEAASWWLFGTATVSAITAAIAGTIAVGG